MTIKKYCHLNEFEKLGVDSALRNLNFQFGISTDCDTGKSRRIVCFGKMSFDLDTLRVEVD